MVVNTLEQETEQSMGLQPIPVKSNLAQQSADLLDKEVQKAEQEFGALSLDKEIRNKVDELAVKTGFKGLDYYFGLDKPAVSDDLETTQEVVEPEDPFVPRVETVDKYGMPLNPSKVKEGSSLRPELRPEDFDPDRNKAEAAENFESAIDYIASMGWLLGQKTKDAKGQDLTKIVTGLDQRNPDHRKSIMGFFYTAQGGEFNPLEKDGEITAWCAAFVHHVLTNLGADTLEVGKSGNNRIRANSFMDYGTAVDGIENAQEGDIVIWDWPRDAKGKIAETSGKKDGRGDHVAFYAGDRITGQGEADYVNVVGGNQSGTVSLRENNSLYVKRNIIGIRRITKNDITVSLTKDLAKQNPIFKPFIANVTNKKEAGYAQGGLTDMNNQTQMAFALGGEAETVDPISGNDVPPGSLPVEVRDDIDAKLSEGEYVVPADVVRFFGVKFFEDLRTEAKRGLQQMDMDGRIGGEPISEGPEMQMAEMGDQDIDALIDAEMNNMNQGGMIGQQNPSNSMYSDPNKMDDVIAKISEASAQNPEIARMLGERGIAVPTTGAMQTPEEIKDANTPEMEDKFKKKSEIGVANGGLMGYANGGDIENYDPSEVPSVSDMGYTSDNFDPYAYLENLLGSGISEITRLEVLGPEGAKQYIYWNSKLPLPTGYTLASKKPSQDGREGRDKSQDDDPLPPTINTDHLSLPDLQLIQQDVKRKTLGATLLGPLGAAVAYFAGKQIEKSLEKAELIRNGLADEDPNKKALTLQIDNFKKGVDVKTGKPLKDLPGRFQSGLAADVRTVMNKNVMSQKDIAFQAQEDEITGIYTNPNFFANKKVAEGKDSNLLKDLIEPEDAIVNLVPEIDNKQDNIISDNETEPSINLDEDMSDMRDTSKDFLDSAMNPRGLTQEVFEDSKKNDMNPLSAPDFGDDWRTVRNKGSDTWGRVWNKNEDGSLKVKPKKVNSGETNQGIGFAFKGAGDRDKVQESVEYLQEGYEAEMNKGGLIGKPKKSYDKGGYVTSKKTKQRKNGLASRP